MNLLLLQPEDFLDSARARINDRRLQHVLSVHRAQVGDSLKVGLIDGLIGQGRIIQLSSSQLELDVQLDQSPPPQLPLTLLLALPRPKMLKRIFQSCATLGVQELILINSYRVEKSYWQTPFLTEEKIREHLILGLEQGMATQLPKVQLRKRFKPFVEDELPSICQGKTNLVAHPYHAQPCPRGLTQPTVLAIGPEGGFIPYEIDKLADSGFQAIDLGQRILRVEAAIVAACARLF
ncbi:16S rRNA (uracil(1498)-N(3))-methyltransferase [Motiliproteus coralliicola]|uniref:Ribosomal RNA small subunit methyltransferase E n=1 Tax=Motiliproteus coralliicola TaxID=2283196 RepID=A0A369WQC1_9GAMM|nr:16S rRNA (uracil(1498)-N(3))-methyltransferase [Motiliproteus coralliicola]RDE22814.1 16S rRNA (uracil(1498)-N(3))-methyltransferase [Motiliproteus coralliicola]